MQKFLSDIPGASGGFPAGLPGGLQVAALNLKPDNNANKNEGIFKDFLIKITWTNILSPKREPALLKGKK